MHHTSVMVPTSYPRFPGDTVGTFMEPIAQGLSARGHEVHVVAPWHPLVTRSPQEGGVYFHFFHYAPLPALNVFGYADALRADVELRPSAIAVAPFALAAGWRVARRVAKQVRATVLHSLPQNSCKLLFINLLLVCCTPLFPHCTPHSERDFPAPRTPAVDRSGLDLCRPPPHADLTLA